MLNILKGGSAFLHMLSILDWTYFLEIVNDEALNILNGAFTPLCWVNIWIYCSPTLFPLRMLDFKSAITDLLFRQPRSFILIYNCFWHWAPLGTLQYWYISAKVEGVSTDFSFFICIIAKTIYQMTNVYLLDWIEMEKNGNE